MNSNDKFEHESMQTPDKIGDFFDSLTQGFKKRSLTLNSETQSVSMAPAELVEFGLKASCKKDKFKLTIKLSWRESTLDQVRRSNFIHLET